MGATHHTFYAPGTLTRVSEARDESSDASRSPPVTEQASQYDGLGRPRSVTVGQEGWTMAHPSSTSDRSEVALSSGGLSYGSRQDGAGRAVATTVLAGALTALSITTTFGAEAVAPGHAVEDWGSTRSVTYDREGSGRIREVRDAVNVPIARLDRRDDGVPRSVTRGAVTTETPHDKLGRSLGTRTSSSGTQNLTRYDDGGRLLYEGLERTCLGGRCGRGYRYDPTTGRLEGIDFRSGDSLTYTYHPEGHPWRIRHSLDGLVTMTYDGKGHLQARDIVLQQQTERESYVHDALGREQQATSSNGSVERWYDQQYLSSFRVVMVSHGGSAASPPSGALRVVEDVRGLRLQTYPSGVVAEHAANGNGLLDFGTADARPVYAVQTWGSGKRPETVVLGGLLERIDAYDERSRLEERIYQVAGRLVRAMRHTYDENDKLLRRRTSWPAGPTQTVTRSDVYTYDGDGRLRSAELEAEELSAGSPPPAYVVPSAVPGPVSFGPGLYGRSYVYTSEDDRPSRVRSRGVPLVAVGSSFQGPFDGETVDGFTRSTDGRGHVARIQNRHGTLVLEHDGLSRLVRVRKDVGLPTEADLRYYYRVDGLLQEKVRTCLRPAPASTCTGGHEFYVYDHRGYLLEVWDRSRSAQAPIARYHYAAFDDEVPVAVELDPGPPVYPAGLRWFFPLVDHAGSVVGLADALGHVVETVVYDPWGTPIVQEPQASGHHPASLHGNRLLFQSHLWDADVDLYFMRARVFDPHVGQFLERDPSGYLDSVNLYAGFANDPVNHRDPSGRNTLDSIAGFAIGYFNGFMIFGSMLNSPGHDGGEYVEQAVFAPKAGIWSEDKLDDADFRRGVEIGQITSTLGLVVAGARTNPTTKSKPAVNRASSPARRTEPYDEVGGPARMVEQPPPATAGQKNALVRYDANFAARQILKSTTNVTPGGRVISVHAAERMVTPPTGRAPTTMGEIDQFLDTATQVRKISPHPLGDTITLRNATAPRVKEVVVDAATGKRVITVITPNR